MVTHQAKETNKYSPLKLAGRLGITGRPVAKLPVSVCGPALRCGGEQLCTVCNRFSTFKVPLFSWRRLLGLTHISISYSFALVQNLAVEICQWNEL